MNPHQRTLPCYVKTVPWQSQWQEDSTLDELHQICLEILSTATGQARKVALAQQIKEICSKVQLFRFSGHVKTYATGLVGNIGELSIPLNARGNFANVRGQRLRIVQTGSGRFTREFSVLKIGTLNADRKNKRASPQK